MNKIDFMCAEPMKEADIGRKLFELGALEIALLKHLNEPSSREHMINVQEAYSKLLDEDSDFGVYNLYRVVEDVRKAVDSYDVEKIMFFTDYFDRVRELRSRIVCLLPNRG